MSFSINNAVIGGTMTRDPEVTYTPKGTAVAKFSLANNRTWKDDRGEKHEKVSFIDCEAWGRTAEVLEEHTGKGHTICVEGRIEQDTWEDKTTGQKRSKLKVVVDRFHFVREPKGSRDDDGSAEDDRRPQRQPAGRRPPPQRQAPPPPRKLPVDPDLDAPEEDDIPF